MTVAVTGMSRVFRYAGIELPDPSPDMTPEQVRDLFSANYPEIATATIDGPTVQNDKLVYEIKKAVGTKG